MSDLRAVVTAGGRVEGEFARLLGTPVKALAPFRGTTFLHLTIDALREAGVEHIAIVGGAEIRRACADRVERIIDESSGGAENLRRALYAWDEHRSLLYLTSDMPFISGAALRTFIDRVPYGALSLPLTEWDDFMRAFPGAPPYGVTLAGEKVVNGGAFLIPAGAQRRVERFATKFFEARKSIWRMARLTGPQLLLQFVFRRLGVAQLETQAQRLLGVPARAVRGAPPELAYDVDVLEEYRYAIVRR
jgi:GTP:adenosylcobinamide-phosphate guanylyltransferase